MPDYPDPLEVGETFLLTRAEQQGSHSEFYQAEDKETGEVFGLKLLEPRLLETKRRQFEGLLLPSESAIGASVHHPNVVKVLGSGRTTTGRDYILFEWLAGETLARRMGGLGFGMHAAIENVIFQMVDALVAVHEAGIVHRDICPRNFMVSPSGAGVTLFDFGTATPATAEYLARWKMVGSEGFRAPEVLEGRMAGLGSDVWSWGAVACQLLTGKPAKAFTSRELPLDSSLACPIGQSLDPDMALRPSATELRASLTNPETARVNL